MSPPGHFLYHILVMFLLLSLACMFKTNKQNRVFQDTE